MPRMSGNRIPPMPEQCRLVNIGMFIQFHLAAVGHLVVWLWMFYQLQQYTPPMHPSDEGYDAFFITTIFVYEGIPISFGILVAVYILFRCLLAYADFGSVLVFMIAFNVIHALLLCITIIVPVRLAIPIVLYSIALYCYSRHVIASRDETANQIQQETTDAT